MRRGVLLAGIASVAVLFAWIAFRPAPTAPVRPAPIAPPHADPLPLPLPASRPAPPSAPTPTSERDPTASPAVADLRALDERFAAFEAMTLDYDLPDGATREEEDRLYVARLKEVSGEAAHLQKAYEDVIAHHRDPRVEVLAQIAIGDCKDALRVDLAEGPTPSYLTPEQAELFAMGMEDKAHAAGVAAQEAWDRAAEMAEAVGADAEIEALLAERRAADE
jgi:hypothetical protein